MSGKGNPETFELWFTQGEMGTAEYVAENSLSKRKGASSDAPVKLRVDTGGAQAVYSKSDFRNRFKVVSYEGRDTQLRVVERSQAFKVTVEGSEALLAWGRCPIRSFMERYYRADPSDDIGFICMPTDMYHLQVDRLLQVGTPAAEAHIEHIKYLMQQDPRDGLVMDRDRKVTATILRNRNKRDEISNEHAILMGLEYNSVDETVEDCFETTTGHRAMVRFCELSQTGSPENFRKSLWPVVDTNFYQSESLRGHARSITRIAWKDVELEQAVIAGPLLSEPAGSFPALAEAIRQVYPKVVEFPAMDLEEVGHRLDRVEVYSDGNADICLVEDELGGYMLAMPAPKYRWKVPQFS